MSEPAWVPLGAPGNIDVGPEVAYAEITADAAITATTFPTANTLITAPAFTADGNSDYIVEGYAPYLVGGSGGSAYVSLWEDAVERGLLAVAPSGQTLPFRAARKIRPAAGAHVYSLRGALSSAGGSPRLGCQAGGANGTYMPAFIRVTKVPSGVAGGGAAVPPTQLLTSLPASPVDGQEIILTDSLTAPTYTWHLRYVAAKASNKWVFIGGTPLLVTRAASLGNTSSTEIDVPGVTFTIPVAGDYQFHFGSTLNTLKAWTAAELRLGPAVGTTWVAAFSSWNNAGDGLEAQSVGLIHRRTALAAGSIAKVMLRSSNGTSNVTAQDTFMEIIPTAVGG